LQLEKEKEKEKEKRLELEKQLETKLVLRAVTARVMTLARESGSKLPEATVFRLPYWRG
jgi:hypothetical protein